MKKRVLIVDDTKFMRMTLAKTFESLGYEVVGEAENGKEAIQKYEDLEPDLVTMDITMREMDGIAALKEIMRMDPEACVVMCSALGQQSKIKEAIQAGAREFINKPFKKEKIEEVLGRVIR